MLLILDPDGGVIRFMRKIAILTDTNSGMTHAEAAQLDVHLLPMPFYLDGQLYYEGVTLSQKEFYQQLQQNREVKTSQPSPGDTMKMWDELLSDHEALVYIPMSGGLSSTVVTARMLASEPPYDGKVFVADNRRISATQWQSVRDAALLREKGLTAEEICAELERTAMDARIYIMVDTLKYLKKGGRVTAAGAMLGDALNIKPILKIEGEKLDAFKKVRGVKAAKQAMIEIMEEDCRLLRPQWKLRVMTAYSGDPELGAEWNRMVQEYFPEAPVYCAPLPLSIACHTGPGALGIGCVRELE
ncbi:MAG: DegV family protein [Candidatus Merdivicinus sp.]|jgi:DegV family protein with EDD domain